MNFTVTPERLALINVDMQNCFVNGHSPDGLPEEDQANRLTVLDRINRLAAACRSAGIKVIHTRHVLRSDGSNAGLLAEIVPPALTFLKLGSETAALHSGLVVESNDIVLDKPRFGAFHATELEMLLRSNGIDSIIITGITTSVCCETTAREANARDFRVFFTSDGTATGGYSDFSSEQVQKFTMATLDALFAQVVTVEEMIDKISQAKRPV